MPVPNNDGESISQRLVDLVDFVEHMVRLGEKPVFGLGEYRQLVMHEAWLKGRIGIRHDQSDEDGPVWLSIDRLKRIAPPEIGEDLQPWVTVSPDPFTEPVVVAVHTETIQLPRADELIEEGILKEEDVQPALRSGRYGEEEERAGLCDVIFRLENLPNIEVSVRTYVQDSWRTWAEEEMPRRETIKIYDDFFGLQQSLQAMDGDQGLEVVWGMGVARWRVDGHDIDHPLVEQLVEIDIDTASGRIFIRPRTTEPQAALKPYFALNNPGADQVHTFTKNFFASFPEEQDISPFNGETFEPILREAASRLHGEARYHPDDVSDITDRNPPPIDATLRVSNTWVIFARKRSDNFFINDLKRLKGAIEDAEELPGPAKSLVTEPSSEPTYQPTLIDIGHAGFGTGAAEPGGTAPPPRPATGVETTRADEFFFPKAFNDDQISIIRRLNEADGVVVQGPPGTGKTHTIANIICHYLATGRRVLVTSKGEAALTVLRDHIPEGIRDLTISLLTNERAGLKQLEQAVSVISNAATQMNSRHLERDIRSGQQRIRSLRNSIEEADRKLGEWADRHLKKIGDSDGILPIELAQRIVGNRDRHGWLPDHPGPEPKYDPGFSDEDIAAAREARKALGENLLYLGRKLPSLSDLPDTAFITAIHDDLVNAKRLEEDAKNRNAPALSLSAKQAIERAKRLCESVERVAAMFKDLEAEPWLAPIAATRRDKGIETDELRLFNALLPTMDDLASRRQAVVNYAVAVPEGAESNNELFEAVNRAARGSRPFGLVAIGKSGARAQYQKIRIEDREPDGVEEMGKVAETIQWRRDMVALAIRWKAIAAEYDLPVLDNDIDKAGRWLASIVILISRLDNVLDGDRKLIESEMPDLFPYGMSAAGVLQSRNEAESAAQIIQVNLSKNRLTGSRDKIGDLLERIADCSGPIVEKMKDFVTNSVGDGSLTLPQITDCWAELCKELSAILALQNDLETVERIARAIATSGAPKWANALRAEPVTGIEDPWAPGSWRESWSWRRQETYLNQIDGRETIRELSKQRLQHEEDLRRTFHKVVENRTFLSLKNSMTEQVESALVMFTSAIRRIGKGTGIRAQRFRRDARVAMERSYAAVPCWIMPSWRVSESLPAVLGSFDLVIVDEASQSDIGALPALVRGKKVLIVGDDKQVSPTGAFVEERQLLQLKHNFLQGQPFGPLVLPGGSLYDLANAMFPGRRIMLHEHFRCVEPIIRFSMQFYSEPIVPLRIAKPSERLDPPLIDVYIPHGQKSRSQINVAEADAIVDEIAEIVVDPAFEGRSIGVVSLIGTKQAHYIQVELFSRIGEEAYLAHDITCGNPATFQGKERDIMFISMVECSQTQSAKTALLWEQRFNVAFSRARDRMYLYRSVDEEELRPDDLKAKAIRHFKSPMESAVPEVDDLIELCEPGFEREVFRRLREKGYRVTPQVKVARYSIDMVVEGDKDRRLAIELDGDQYHTPEQWADDLVRQRNLERMGWRFWRCWGSSFYLDPEICMADLIGTLDSLGIKPLGGESPNNVYTEHRVLDDRTTEPAVLEPQPAISTTTAEVVTLPPAKHIELETEKHIEPKEVAVEQRVDSFLTGPSSATTTREELPQPELRTDSEFTVEVGDRVLIAYNDDEIGRQHTIRISDTENDPDMNVLRVGHPIVQAVLGASIDDELEIPAGGGVRMVTVVGIEKDPSKLQTGTPELSTTITVPASPASLVPSVPTDETETPNNAGVDSPGQESARVHVTSSVKGEGYEPSGPGADLNSVAPYKAWPSMQLRDPRDISLSEVADQLVEIIEVEGPVILKRVFKLYKRAAGFRRLGTTLRGIFLLASGIALKSGRVEVEDERNLRNLTLESVVRRTGTPPIAVRKRGPRDLKEIPRSELARITRSIISTQSVLDEKNLYRQILDFYDLKHLTDKVRNSLSEIVSEANFRPPVSDRSPAETGARGPKSPAGAKYKLELLGERLKAGSLAEILVVVLRTLHEIDSEFLPHLGEIKWSSPPYHCP